MWHGVYHMYKYTECPIETQVNQLKMQQLIEKCLNEMLLVFEIHGVEKLLLAI